jgi:hypothetical protein
MGLRLNRPVGVGGAEKVCPLKDFGETELGEGNDDGTHGLFGADDENLNGFAVGLGIAVEFEEKFKRHRIVNVSKMSVL